MTLETGNYIISPAFTEKSDSDVIARGAEDFSMNPKKIVFLPLKETSLSMWRVEKQKGDTYKLSIGGTGVTSINNKLYTILQETPPVEEWVVTYRAHQKAYSVAQKSDGRVWVANNELYSQIEVWHGIAAGSSPTYPTSQLFKFVRADRDKD
ncbi:hypothetical protein HYDPIDRAFT_117922 [Hydnomerulius pinastri MD-312]|uniref:Ricin B lectin domain-containing protein n=1 Tax=Hydnomerulius pinastri MD-312 TaxID=994086 RepID=A0A0C9W9Y4_9AGAM|nr:hypothetical protein HYDPIDRAFT_117922 [Hydnomerulius pinastri MD-312]